MRVRGVVLRGMGAPGPCAETRAGRLRIEPMLTHRHGLDDRGHGFNWFTGGHAVHRPAIL